MSGPRTGSLFSGYGGLEMAVNEVYGATTAWVSDIDKGACKLLAHRYPDVPNIGDVTTVDWSQVEPVDILTGGSPCQDLSHAGRRAGMTDGTRSNLWVAMREGIARLRPAIVVWENVRGAYSAAADSALEPCAGCVGDGSGVHLRALGRVLGDLSDLGYDTSWHGLRAADVGAPHGRFRVFVVATDARGLRRGAGWSSGAGEATGRRTSADLAGCGDSSLTMLPTPQARDWKGHGPADGNRHDPNLSAIPLLLPTPRATDGTKGGPNQAGSSGDLMLPAAVQPERLMPTPRAGADRTSRSAATRQDSMSGPSLGQAVEIAAGDLPREFDSWDELPGSWQPSVDGAQWGDYAAAITRWEQHLGRPAPAPTMTSSKGNPQLAPRFVEWLMGLPEGWVDDVPGLTRNEKLKLLGNGVVPQQSAHALRVMGSWEVAA